MLNYLVDLSDLLDVINITLPECRIDILEANAKVTSLQQNIQNMKEDICSNNLNNLKTLQTFMSTVGDKSFKTTFSKNAHFIENTPS